MTDPTPPGSPPADGAAGEAAFARRSWPADPRQLGPIRDEVRRWVSPLAMTTEACDDLVFAVSEVVTNAIEHAYPLVDGAAPAGESVELTLWTEPDSLFIEVADHGRWQHPATNPVGRGLGIPAVHRVVESVLIHFDPRGTRVLLRHGLPVRSRPADPAEAPLVAGLDYTDRGGAS